MIKKVWFNDTGSRGGYLSLCIRLAGWDPLIPRLVANSTVLPPIGERMDLKKAKELGVAEEHWVLTGFTHDDLGKIRDAIDEQLGDR
jgi:hypothetical protein